MTELVFMEGVSGVGKSTITRALAEQLRSHGYAVREYLEFDSANPIDFYCTACLSVEEYDRLCKAYPAAEAVLRANAIPAGEKRLVRYYKEDSPMFADPLLSELVRSEFCYKPAHPVPLCEYTAILTEVWRGFSESLDGTYDFILFDGSLLHHPLNDMIRNYHAAEEQRIAHIHALLRALGSVKRRIFYLHIDDIAAQLARARRDRGQSAPTQESIRFWQNRSRLDRAVLRGLPEEITIYNITNGGWDTVREQIRTALCKS